MHILLIEPDRPLGRMYTGVLQSHGHTVSLAAGAQSAIMAADASRPDVVVLELQLAEHSGIEFLYEFRSYAEWQSVPVIVHSMVAPQAFQDSRRILMEQVGVVAYLYKPETTLAQLVTVLEAHSGVQV